MLPKILALQSQNKTMAQIAADFNDDGIKTFNGGEWHQSTVSRLLKAAAAA